MISAFRHLVVLLLALALTACASRSLETEHTSCTYPDSNRIPAPSFICDQQVDGYPVTELLEIVELGDSTQSTIDAAFAEQVEIWSTQWAGQWFAGTERQASARQHLQAFLHDRARIIRSRISPKQTLWLLIGVDVPIETIRMQTVSATVTSR